MAFTERLFAEELHGHPILKNRSLWRSFPTVRNERWSHGNVVLVGDAAHTVHFSVGSGTKLAMEDAIALSQALRRHADVPAALTAYEAERRPEVESLQRAAQVSLEWFETTERYRRLEPIQFAMTHLTRSLRVTHENLKVRDPALRRDGRPVVRGGGGPPERRAAPARPRRRRRCSRRSGCGSSSLSNRIVVSPMCQYSAEDGTPNDWHLVHLGSRAAGGAALVVAEMTDVSREGRISPGCTGMYKPEHVDAWKRIVDFVHGTPARASPSSSPTPGARARRGGCGRGSTSRCRRATGRSSPRRRSRTSRTARSRGRWTRRDMDLVRDQFVRAAGMAEAAGFDMLELHMAHGYLLASFISPLTNVRTDAYGGPLEHRMRYPLEVFDAVRAAWPADKPISVKISATDWAPGGHDRRRRRADRGAC